MARKYWRIGDKYIYLEIFNEGYPYVWGGSVSGYKEKDGKKIERKEYISNLSNINIDDIIIVGGVINIHYIGKVIERPVYLFPCDGPARKASFEEDYNIYEANKKTKELFKEVFEENDDYQEDIVCLKTRWYTIPEGLRMPERQPLGSCNEIKNQKVIKYINSKIIQSNKGLKMESWVDIVKSSKNTILTGAPGTGKTFLAQKIARKIVGENSIESNIEFVQFHPSYDYTDFVEGLRPVDKGELQIGFKLKDGIFKQFCKKAIEHSDSSFVFIIDEINRGEINKIFGELFFSIDPGYRGERGKVRTQYFNLIPEDDEFKNGFYIPENVYIIGTMNDIDRSVESFDFAMRRRFTWIEIKAPDTAAEMFQNEIPQHKDNALERLNALNNVISDGSIETLNESYHIGGAYFLKLKDYNGDYEKLWDYHLFPLLYEYLRGTHDIDENLEKLKNAYNLQDENNGEGDAEDEG
jgi:DNA polymerase III delta prime subunit